MRPNPGGRHHGASPGLVPEVPLDALALGERGDEAGWRVGHPLPSRSNATRGGGADGPRSIPTPPRRPLEVRLDPRNRLLLWRPEYGPRPGPRRAGG
jgi:hypothetical protein